MTTDNRADRLLLLNDKCDLLFRQVMDLNFRQQDETLSELEKREAAELIEVKRAVLRESEHERTELLAELERERRRGGERHRSLERER